MSPAREAVRLLRKIRLRAQPDRALTARRPGRPPGTKNLDEAGAMLFLFIDVMGVRRADVLRALGWDSSSGSSADYEWIRRRVNAYREVLRWPPEELQAGRRALLTRPDRPGSYDPRKIFSKVLALNPKLFLKVKSAKQLPG
jgi:hypothetical protein